MQMRASGHEARASRTPSLRDRCMFGEIGTNQAEDRLGLSARDDLRAARASSRSAGYSVPQASHVITVSGRANGLFMRDATTRQPLMIDAATAARWRSIPLVSTGTGRLICRRWHRVGAVEQIIVAQAVKVSPAFVQLIAHVRSILRNGRRRFATCARHYPRIADGFSHTRG